MAQILNTQTATQTITNSSQQLGDVALSKLQGQLAQLQPTANGGAQLVLNGQAISLPRLPQNDRSLQQTQQVKLNISQQSTQTFLELVKPGNTTQSLQLSPTQGKQLLNVIANSPSVLANYTPGVIEAKVLKVAGDQLMLQVSGKTLTLNVPNASAQFKEGQLISLRLLAKQDSWQLEIKDPKQGADSAKQIQPTARQLPQVLAATLPRNTPLMLDNQDKVAHLNIQRVLPSSLQMGFKPEMPGLPTFSIDKHQQLKMSWSQSEQVLAKLPLEGGLKQKAIDVVAGSMIQSNASNPINAGQTRLSPEQIGKMQISQELAMEMTTQADKTAVRALARETILASVDGNKIRSDLQPLMRGLQAKADSPSFLINNLEKSLSSIVSQLNSPIGEYVSEMSKLISNDKLNQANGQITAQEIKQLLTAAPLPVTPSTINSPPPQANFLAGLMGMLQVSLAARLMRQQPEHLDKLTQLLVPSLIASDGKTDGKQKVSKSLSDFFQADSKLQILKNIDKLLSGHQFNKLSNMESQLQGQDSLYYVLPIGDNGQRKDLELLIKREQEKDPKTNKAKVKGTYWALTMKLPVGDIGEILAKAKINGNNLDLDFYTSNDATKILVFNFIPVLKKRFEQLGIDMGNCRCQLGKIPEALQQRPYHLFEARA
ncbi:hypothetical protein KIH87_15810 [Paraneptunicella aestuarii]|uniref:hypothetical protein n=1 Tax=Paraneptunicella aestuarii TaxID=2831148 RepID=UPI001E2BAF45|nr:hypothetical protein [Paraneptunicella aestuarii]UAA38138.1 hypothetical protein KIH87_15810 [Paraneptunicella aestuarii]